MAIRDSILSDPEFSKLTPGDWQGKIAFRGVDTKYDHRLEEAILCYERKIPLLQKQLLEVAVAKAVPELYTDYPVGDEQTTINKIARLKDKLACCVKEKHLRRDKLVVRIPHDTNYYIDLNGGDDGADGLGTGTAWLTIENYTTTTVRSAGDIAYIRAGTTETIAAIVQFDEDGTTNALIQIIGCDSVTNDPWSDVSDVLPIIDFNSNAYYLYLNTDNYWGIKRLDIRNSTINTSGLGAVSFRSNEHCELVECTIHLNTVCGVGIYWGHANIIKTCALTSNGSYNIRGYVNNDNTVDGCALTGGTGTNYGIYLDNSPSVLYVKDSTFSGHGTNGVYINVVAWTYFRNCLFSDTTPFGNGANAKFYTYSEDHNQAAGATYFQSNTGIIRRVNAVQLDSVDSIQMEPGSAVGQYEPLSTADALYYGGWYEIDCPAGVTTLTIKARETVAWATDPGATEFYFVAEYLDGASGESRALAQSTQALSGTTEISFTMTFTPDTAAVVYIKAVLTKYESGKYVNISTEVAVS